jgi:two-component system chemotaxis response regulator CheB
LSRIFKDLPADLPAAILVVRHIHPEGKDEWLPRQLTSVGHVPVKIAENGERIRQGTAYIAPAGKHLLVDEGNFIRAGKGALEQGTRPAIDALFRSAARAFGPQVIGVILTGMLSDGALGLRAIQDAGGITVVQNPESAEHGDMPRAAMRGLAADYCLDLSEIGPLLDLLVRRSHSDDRCLLETGLASSVRLMKDRARLLAKLAAQSHGNPKTARFLDAEITALEREITDIQSIIPRERAKSPPE